MNCKHCQSQKIVKAGKIRGYQRFKCKSSDRHFTNTPLRGKPAAMKALAVVLYSLCNASYGMIAKLLRVSNVVVYKWIKAGASRLPELNTQCVKGILQIEEFWHFVNGKKTRCGSGEPLILLQGKLWPGKWVAVAMPVARDS